MGRSVRGVSSVVRSRQTGSVALPSNETPVVVTIAKVVPEKCVLNFYLTSVTTGAITDARAVPFGRVSSPTSITFEKRGTSSLGTIEWALVELF
jgi:hypothetical protein